MLQKCPHSQQDGESLTITFDNIYTEDCDTEGDNMAERTTGVRERRQSWVCEAHPGPQPLCDNVNDAQHAQRGA
jgi:hypothetical protein